MIGAIDFVDEHNIRGWAKNAADDDTPVSLLVLVDGDVVRRTTTRVPPDDSHTPGSSDGRHRFEVDAGGIFRPDGAHMLRVIREADGAELSGSPYTVLFPASRPLRRDAYPSFSIDEVIQAIYRGLLDRDPDQAGLDTFRRALTDGMPLETFVGAVAASPEFVARCASHGPGTKTAEPIELTRLAAAMERAVLTLAIGSREHELC